MASPQRHSHHIQDDELQGRDTQLVISSPPVSPDMIQSRTATVSIAVSPFPRAPNAVPASIIPDYPPTQTNMIAGSSHNSDSSNDSSESERACNLSGKPTPRCANKPSSQGPIQNKKDHFGTAASSSSVIPYPSSPGQGVAYTDYSRVPIEDLCKAFIFAGVSVKEPPFPVKLHRILNNPEFHDIVSWLPHGRSWRVLKPMAFEAKVIPLHFRHCRYSSFMRQVNGWGFRRVFEGPDLNSYYHELFLRGMPHLCHKMRRPTRKHIQLTAADASKCPAPDFYSISEKYPLPEQSARKDMPVDPAKSGGQSPVKVSSIEKIVPPLSSLSAAVGPEDSLKTPPPLPPQQSKEAEPPNRKDATVVAGNEYEECMRERVQLSSILAQHHPQPTAATVAPPIVHQPGAQRGLSDMAVPRTAQLDQMALLQHLRARRSVSAQHEQQPVPSQVSSACGTAEVDRLRQALLASQLQNCMLVSSLASSVEGAASVAAGASNLRQLVGLRGLAGGLGQQQQRQASLSQLQMLPQEQQTGGLLLQQQQQQQDSSVSQFLLLQQLGQRDQSPFFRTL